MTVTIALVAATAVAMLGDRDRTPSASAASARSLAVLPFIGVGTANEPYVGVGMADALITRLGNLKEIAVRPTTAIDEFDEANRDAIAAGRQLKVDAVLDGRVQRSDGRLRVTAQLIDVGSGATLWSGAFDEPSKEIFALQDAIAERLADTLVPQLTEEMKGRLGRTRVRNVDAYEQYVRGRLFWNSRSKDSLQRALYSFQAALEEDPTYAEAHAGLADCYNLFPEHGLASAHEAMPRAKAAALQAVHIDPGLGEAHASLGYALANYDFDFAGAERSFRRAIDLAPSYATAYQWYGELLNAMRRPEEALAAFQRARDLDPLSPIISALVEYMYFSIGKPEQAAEGLRRVIALHPRFGMARHYLADVYQRQQRFPEALDEIEQAHRLSGDDPEDAVRLRRAYLTGGTSGFWRHRLALELQQAHPSPFYVAVYYGHLGDRDRAIEWLENAYEQRDRSLIFLRLHQAFAPLSSDPRFERLLRRVGI